MSQFELYPGTGLRKISVEITQPPVKVDEGFFYKERLSGEVVGNNLRRRVSLFIKNLSLGCTPEYYLSQWEKYKVAGIPVVGSVRLLPYNDRQVVTGDVTTDGSVLFDKALAKHKSHELGQHVFKDVFLHLMQPNELQAIREKAEEYARNATSIGLLINPDDPFSLRIHPDGKWDIISLDLDDLGRYREISPADYGSYNMQSVQEFMHALEKIQRKMTPHTWKFW